MFYGTFYVLVTAILGLKYFCECSTDKYAVLIDAGSSGSRLKVYKFAVNERGKIGGIQDVEALKNSQGKLKIRPGISSLADDLTSVEEYLKTLLDTAKDLVPSGVQASTPILLMATAGMRLLTVQQQQSLMREVRRVFADKNLCPFHFENRNAHVITGKDEAVYGWITVNFLKGSFSEPGTKTYGTLEMGGASTQVSFNRLRQHVTQIIRIAGKIYKLYAKSSLGYGVNEIIRSFLGYLAQTGERGSDGGIKSPCHNNGYQETLEVGGEQIRVVGAPNYQKCARIIDFLFLCSDPSERCPFRNQPSLNGTTQEFYAFSIFYGVLKSIGALRDSPSVTVRDIGNSVKEYCNRDYAAVRAGNEYARTTCLSGVYIHELFTKGYRVGENFKTTFVKRIAGFKTDWILGSILYKMDLL